MKQVIPEGSAVPESYMLKVEGYMLKAGVAPQPYGNNEATHQIRQARHQLHDRLISWMQCPLPTTMAAAPDLYNMSIFTFAFRILALTSRGA